MSENNNKLQIRCFEITDTDKVISIWKECQLTREWNNPLLDIQRKVNFQKDLFFVGEIDNLIIATAMFGYDGHRGWLNYFAVMPKFQNRGYGKQLLTHGEDKLLKLGCPKINLQIRDDNLDAINFYEITNYKKDKCVSYGKRLIED
jgi:ribosomal protein S18 acetylase RimI-like enzyme